MFDNSNLALPVATFLTFVCRPFTVYIHNFGEVVIYDAVRLTLHCIVTLKLKVLLVNLGLKSVAQNKNNKLPSLPTGRVTSTPGDESERGIVVAILPNLVTFRVLPRTFWLSVALQSLPVVHVQSSNVMQSLLVGAGNGIFSS